MPAKYCVVILIFFTSFPIFATSKQLDDLMKLSLDELLNVEISVASFRSEKITDTPAIVSSFSTAQLNAFGIRDIRELLDFVPGFLIERGTLGVPVPVVRGAAESSGRNILMMIDGIPTWSTHTGFPPLLSVPFAAIDKVEIIRGPGAVIYGTNAIGGVINFITKKESGGKAILQIEQEHQLNGSGFFNHLFKNGLRLGVGLEQQNDSGFDGNIQDALGNFATAKYYDKPSSLILNLSNESFQFLAHQFENHGNGLFPAVADFSIQGDFVTEGRLLSLSHKLQKENYSIDSYLDYNSIYVEATYPFFQEVTAAEGGDGTYRLRVGSKGNYSINNNFHLLAGFELEQRAMEEQLITQFSPELTTFVSQPEDETEEHSLFLQTDYTLNTWRFLLGARYIDNEKAGSSLTPRATIVYNITNDQSIKLMYGRGFSSPAFNQTSLDIDPLIIGNPTLEAETIDSFDIAYTHLSDNFLFILNFFKFTGDKFIVINPAPVETGRFLTFVNSNEFSHRGAEFDFQSQFSNWKVFANASYLKEGNGDISDSIFASFVPKLMANLGVSFQEGDHSIGLKLRYLSKRQSVDSALGIDLNYNYNYDDISFFATLNNLLGEDQRSSDLSSFATTTFQREPEDPYLQFGIEAIF